MIKACFGLTETGAVRNENQDSYLLDAENGIFAVADGLGGLPNGAKASKIALEVLYRKLSDGANRALNEIISEINEETRTIGFQLSSSGFGTTLTMGRIVDDGNAMEIAHVGDSAAYMVDDSGVRLITTEHTVAARMATGMWEDASDAIPLSAHHTLTQCIGQDLYIDPQVLKIPLHSGCRLFFMTDGATKPLASNLLDSFLMESNSIEKIAQSISFRIEAAGSPDNYTIIAVEFA